MMGPFLRSGFHQPVREPFPIPSCSTISAMAFRATDLTVSGSTYSVSSVLGNTTIGASGTPLPFMAALAKMVNRSVTRATEGMPSLMTLTLSWTLHAVQDPQLARPTIASWARSLTSLKVSCEAADARGIGFSKTSATPYCSLSTIAICSAMMFMLVQRLFNMATVVPRRSPSWGISVSVGRQASAAGLKMDSLPGMACFSPVVFYLTVKSTYYNCYPTRSASGS